MKFIVLALLLPVLVTSIYDSSRFDALLDAKYFEEELKLLIKKKDFNAVAKYISDDFGAHICGYPYIERKSQFLDSLRKSFGRTLFDGKKATIVLRENLSISYSSDGLNETLTLRKNAALKAKYELVKYRNYPIDENVLC